jgi:hypothetical protein
MSVTYAARCGRPSQLRRSLPRRSIRMWGRHSCLQKHGRQERLPHHWNRLWELSTSRHCWEPPAQHP